MGQGSSRHTVDSWLRGPCDGQVTQAFLATSRCSNSPRLSTSVKSTRLLQVEQRLDRVGCVGRDVAPPTSAEGKTVTAAQRVLQHARTQDVHQLRARHKARASQKGCVGSTKTSPAPQLSPRDTDTQTSEKCTYESSAPPASASGGAGPDPSPQSLSPACGFGYTNTSLNPEKKREIELGLKKTNTKHNEGGRVLSSSHKRIHREAPDG